MAQQYIVLNMTGLAALNVINDNFTEVYDGLVIPIKLSNVSATTSIAIPANTFIQSIMITGSPTISIGYEDNGTELLPEMTISDYQFINAQAYFFNAGYLWFTFYGAPVSANIRIDLIYNYN